MGWLAFIAAIVTALAWPGLLACLAWSFREPLTAVLHSLKRVSLKTAAGEVEAEIGNAEAKDTSTRQDLSAAKPVMPGPGIIDNNDLKKKIIAQVASMGGTPPNYMMSHLWMDLLTQIRAAVLKRDPERPLSSIAGTNAIVAAQELGLLPPLVIDQISSLESARSVSLMPGADVSYVDVLRFAEVIDGILSHLRSKN